MKMARDKARKESNETKKVPREVKNSGKKSNLGNGIASETQETTRRSKEKSSSLSSCHSSPARKKSQKTKMRENLSHRDKNDSSAATLIENNHLELVENEVQKNVNQKSSRSATKAHNSKPSVGKKYVLRSLSNGIRVLRPRSNKSAKTHSKTENHSLEFSTGKSKERRKKYKKKKHVQRDELSIIRMRVKYFLARIGFEQNMIDAYSSEGWKGQSQEKIRPEKELQKAASKILQCKLRIREAFHQLHCLCMDGSLEETAFDLEGQVNSEDIFCAKCRSKDLFPDNDIILCDGVCDRGFHQKCLEPPLATEDIPPGDEGWLCPACDCKLDCVDLVNYYLDTDFDLEDGWENFFANAAAIAAGDGTPLELEDMPSDDTEDDDYDPDGLELPDGTQQEGSSSEESGSISGAETSSDSISDDEGSESSEGSESDDGSEFSVEGDSEHFSKYLVESGKKKFKMARDKKALENFELPEISDPDEKDNIPSPVSGKRHRQEVDYKKLHDELYGVDASDRSMSEDDEEWGLGKPSKKGRLVNMEQSNSSVSKEKQLKNLSVTKIKVKAPDVESPEDIKISKSSSCKTGKSEKANGEFAVESKEKHHEGDSHAQVLPLEVKYPTNESASQQQQQCENFPVSAKRSTSSRLPKTAVEKLQRVFAEFRFPSRSVKEDLAKEFGISFKRVNTWFRNARSPPGKKKAVTTIDQDSIKLPPVKDHNVPEELQDSESVEKGRNNIKSFSEQGKKLSRRKHGNNEFVGNNIRQKNRRFAVPV